MQKHNEDYTEAIETMNTVSLRGMRPFLRCIRGEFAGYDIPILTTGILIGRDANVCQLVFADDPSVSRYHCRVSYNVRTGFFVVTDLNSSNGVFTENSNRVDSGGKLALIPGQRFMLCDSHILFEVVVKQENENV